jgi:thiol-disulfide isomerase/thioredoxin
MTQEERGPVHAPELAGGEWLQGGPVPVRGSGQPVLIDFWDYTCVNCLRTLPYLKEWHRRYKALGLTVVGVHTPEFSFARNAEHVRAAIAHLELPYPVVLDANGAIWQAYANRYWPAKYFIDARGYTAATTTARAPIARPRRRSRRCCANRSRRSCCPASWTPCATTTGPAPSAIA